MKQRIVSHLMQFANKEFLDNPSKLMLQLSEECNQSIQTIFERSERILGHLLHHYSGFSVETIDGFNHRLIRTFSKDLKLASNFEVTLDQKQLLEQAVDTLLSKTGEDLDTTQLLVDFTLQKTDDDRSWDISRDLVEATKMLFSENDLKQVELLKGKSLADFNQFSNLLLTRIKAISSEIRAIATDTLQLIDESGLQHDDFNRSYYPKYLQKLLSDKTDDYVAKWQLELLDKPLYPGRVVKDNPQAAAVMDELAPVFSEAFNHSKHLVFRRKLLENIRKNLTPLSVINLVRGEIEDIKSEENIIPIAEFNTIISNEIKHQPAPFIYERLGERYRHFFIDEFQDTSLLQWENLMPLIENALSQEFTDGSQGSLLIVGDAKQSIYRWRGGLPEQFIDLYNCNNPFPGTEKRVENLEINFRSAKQIIEFNNSFFSHIATYFTDPVHAELYKLGNRQHTTDKEGGYVHIEFVPANNKNELHELYAEKIKHTILDLRATGFAYSDICILTRTKDDGVRLGAALLQEHISVVSSETLLLQHSPLVAFLLNCLTLRTSPDNDEAKAHLLLFLYDHLDLTEENCDFMSGFFPSDSAHFEAQLRAYGIEFSMEKIAAYSLYEACEYCIRIFQLMPLADAYLDGFLNLVHDFQQQYSAAHYSFFDYWETKKETAAISTGEGMDAIRLMTIHKAKGLEFPVVLFPYADVNIYREKTAKAWYPVNEFIDTFDTSLISYNKEVENYGTIGAALHDERRKKLQLDNLNLLYVSLTRAVERLYVFCQQVNESSSGIPQNYNQLFMSYLRSEGLWNEAQMSYGFGTAAPGSAPLESAVTNEITPEYICTFPEEHNLNITSRDASLWHSKAQLAMDTGTLLHELMSKIIHKDDLSSSLSDFTKRLPAEDKEVEKFRKISTSILNHPELSAYFSGSDRVEVERDIITSQGELLRPDRLNIYSDGSVTLIDYKTGAVQPAHKVQINTYAKALETMGYRIREKLIIYASEEEILINKF